MSIAAKAKRITKVMKQKVAQINPILHGLDQDEKAVILANLVAQWLAGYLAVDDASGEINHDNTADIRTEMLVNWISMVDDLIPINEMLRKN